MTLRNWWTGGLVSVALAGVLAVAGVGAAPTTVAEAAKTGDREAVRQMLRSGADVNSVQGDGMTALHWAASRGDGELTALLLTGRI